MQSEEITVYCAEQANMSIIGSLRTAVDDMLRGRHVLRHIFIRDFVSQFRQRWLGYLWALLIPILGIATFLFMYLIGVLRPGVTDIPYPIFLFTGMGLWGIMMGALGAISSSLLAQSDLLLRTNIPPIVLALSGVASLMYANIIHCVSLLVLSLAFGLVPSVFCILYPLLIMPLFLLGIGVGLILAVVSASARDVASIVMSVLNFVLFISPVYYATNFTHPILRAVVTANPFTYLIDLPRDMFFLGHSDSWPGFIVWTVVSMVILVLAIHGFYVVKDKVAERL